MTPLDIICDLMICGFAAKLYTTQSNAPEVKAQFVVSFAEAQVIT